MYDETKPFLSKQLLVRRRSSQHILRYEQQNNKSNDFWTILALVAVGKFVTARQIEERLFKETNRDVSLKIERIQNKEEWIVSGRGELHLSILIENMRREGYELQVSKPKAIMKEIDGVLCEPYEEVTIEAPDDCIGAVIESLGYRRGVLETMDLVMDKHVLFIQFRQEVYLDL